MNESSIEQAIRQQTSKLARLPMVSARGNEGDCQFINNHPFTQALGKFSLELWGENGSLYSQLNTDGATADWFCPLFFADGFTFEVNMVKNGKPEDHFYTGLNTYTTLNGPEQLVSHAQVITLEKAVRSQLLTAPNLEYRDRRFYVLYTSPRKTGARSYNEPTEQLVQKARLAGEKQRQLYALPKVSSLGDERDRELVLKHPFSKLLASAFASLWDVKGMFYQQFLSGELPVLSFQPYTFADCFCCKINLEDGMSIASKLFPYAAIRAIPNYGSLTSQTQVYVLSCLVDEAFAALPTVEKRGELFYVLRTPRTTR